MAVAWIALARCVKPQGRKGEVLAELLTDFPEALVERPRVYLAPEGFSGSADEATPCRVTASWMPTGRNEGRIVLTLAGVTTMDEAAALSGRELLIEAGDRAPLEEGASYISDLIGCMVTDDGVPIGVVREVQFPTSADGRRRLEEASPLLVVDLSGGRGEALIPYAKAFLRSADFQEKTLAMMLPEGLLEVALEDGAAAEPEKRRARPDDTIR